MWILNHCQQNVAMTCNSHLDIRSCWVGEVHLLELNSTIKLFWNYALIGTGINGWFLCCVHV